MSDCGFAGVVLVAVSSLCSSSLGLLDAVGSLFTCVGSFLADSGLMATSGFVVSDFVGVSTDGECDAPMLIFGVARVLEEASTDIKLFGLSGFSGCCGLTGSITGLSAFSFGTVVLTTGGDPEEERECDLDLDLDLDLDVDLDLDLDRDLDADLDAERERELDLDLDVELDPERDLERERDRDFERVGEGELDESLSRGLAGGGAGDGDLEPSNIRLGGGVADLDREDEFEREREREERLVCSESLVDLWEWW